MLRPSVPLPNPPWGRTFSLREERCEYESRSAITACVDSISAQPLQLPLRHVRYLENGHGAGNQRRGIGAAWCGYRAIACRMGGVFRGRTAHALRPFSLMPV